ncbi:MAG: hypothetical protein GY723_17100 [bacterium]|nr:hypothetical protein [bacterium]MCP5065108.1 hypothetical protein [bacterium]
MAFLTAFFALGLGGWPGEFVREGELFCEAFRSSWIKQPANTWSNLGFVAAGLWMATRIRNGVDLPTVGRNPFTRSRWIPVLYAALVVFLGPGSMAMHGSGRAWGATADVVAMLLYIAFPVAYAGTRCFGGGARAFGWFFLVLAGGLGIPRALGIAPWSGSATYAVLIPALIVFEAVGARRRPEVSRDWRPLIAAGASFVTALTIWRLSHTGAPLCDADSLLQGHAIWHLLCASTTVGIFLFYAAEDDPSA